MKIFLLIISLLTMVNGCGSNCGPKWQSISYNHIEEFKRCFFDNQERTADIHFNKAINTIKKSGNFNILAKAYLTKYSLMISVLEDIDSGKYYVIEDIEPNKVNLNYYNFIIGDFDNVDERSLPHRYRSTYRALKDENTKDLGREISKIEDPLSRLIAIGIAVKKKHYDEFIFQTALDTASVNGWKKPLLVYLEKLKNLYSEIENAEKREQLQKKINIISELSFEES